MDFEDEDGEGPSKFSRWEKMQFSFLEKMKACLVFSDCKSWMLDTYHIGNTFLCTFAHIKCLLCTCNLSVRYTIVIYSTVHYIRIEIFQKSHCTYFFTILVCFFNDVFYTVSHQIVCCLMFSSGAYHLNCAQASLLILFLLSSSRYSCLKTLYPLLSFDFFCFHTPYIP